mmetsp:Transcript_81633/g.218339  ORF Transcript_81633/g.218339 Transcript_81633/m.218339 type:complete len:827 (-) Transcript_81633:125-2605(-)
MRVAPALCVVALAGVEVCEEADREEVALLQLRGAVRAAEGAGAPCTNSTILDADSGACLTLAQYSQRHRDAGACPTTVNHCLTTEGCFLDREARACLPCTALKTVQDCNKANAKAALTGASCVWNDGGCAAGATVILGLPPTVTRLKEDWVDASAGMEYRPFAVKPIKQVKAGGAWDECTDETRCPRPMDFAVFTKEAKRSTGGFWRTGAGTDTCERHFDYQWPFATSRKWRFPAMRLVHKPYSEANRGLFIQGSDQRGPWLRVYNFCRSNVACKAIACVGEFVKDCGALDRVQKPSPEYKQLFAVNRDARPWGTCGPSLSTPRQYNGVGFEVTLRCPSGAEFLTPQVLLILNHADDYMLTRTDWEVVWDGEVIPVADARQVGVASTCWVSFDGPRESPERRKGVVGTCTKNSWEPECMWRAMKELKQLGAISCQLRVPTTVPQQHVMKLLYRGTKEQVIRVTNNLPQSFLTCADSKYCLQTLGEFPFEVAERFRAENRLQARCVLGLAMGLKWRAICKAYKKCLRREGNLQALRATAAAAGLGGGPALLQETQAAEVAANQTSPSDETCANPSTADLQGLTCNCLPTWKRRCSNIAKACRQPAFYKAHRVRCEEIKSPHWENAFCIQSMFCFEDSVCRDWKIANGCAANNWRRWYAGELTIAYDEGEEVVSLVEQHEPAGGGSGEQAGAEDSLLAAQAVDHAEQGDAADEGSDSQDDSAEHAVGEAEQGEAVADRSDHADGDEADEWSDDDEDEDDAEVDAGAASLAEQYPGENTYEYQYQPPPPISYTVEYAPAYLAGDSDVRLGGYTTFHRRRCTFSPLATGQ